VNNQIHNAFSKHYVPELKIKPTWNEARIVNLAAKDREELTLKTNLSAYLTIGTKADSDKRGANMRARI
jgi:hypothetical protein